MPLEGRGRNYSRSRGVVESVLARAFRGAWPAALVRRAGLQRPVRIVRHAVRPARWPAGRKPLKIGFASDLHLGPTTHLSLLEEAFAALAAEKPDVLLLGGDFVFLEAPPLAALVDLLRRVNAPLGRFAVMGNHDLWGDDRAIRRVLEGEQVTVLVNETRHLPAPYDDVAICGLDDPWTGERDRSATFADARTNDVRVLLMHAPEGLTIAGDEPFDVAMCGHTHGGHVALPGGIPIVVPGPLSRRYAHGRHDVGDGRTLLVSRGLGSTESALRLFADPDVMLVRVG